MRIILLTTTAVCLAMPSLALAQAPQAATAGSSEDGATATTEGLGDIIVTAQRREESLQRAAVAVDVVSGADLIAAGITQLDRLTEQVPALTVQPSSTGNLIFIRGVGNFTLTANSDPATAFNYDGVYVARPTSTTGVFYDLQRVEVLKGPQGTLYGRNATGGAINVIPTQPKLGEFSGYATASFGSYDALTAEGAINVPMGEDGALRVAGSISRHDGYLTDGMSDEKTTALRVQMKARLTPELTARVAGDFSHTGGRGAGTTYLGNYIYNPVAGRYVFIPSNLPVSEGALTPRAQAFRLTVPAGPAGRRLDALNISPFQNNEYYGTNAQIDWDTGIGTFTIVPAWRQSSLNYLSEAAAFGYRQREEDEQHSLEARLTGKRIGMFDYTLGGYYFEETIKIRTALSLSAAASFLNSTYTTKSLAPFGRLTAHLSDRLRLVGGVRYTEDKKSVLGTVIGGTIVCNVRVAGVPTCPTAPLFPLVDSPAQIPFAFPPFGVPAVPLIVGGVPSGAIAVRSDKIEDSRLKNSRITYRGAVEFDIAPQSLLYASIETGYRSGGFSPARGFETFAPEYITAYTIGAKNRFFDNRLQLNIEAFWWKYRDQQISAVRTDLDGRTANITQNIGRARIRGIEAEGRFLLTPTTLISTNVQYLDAKNLSFTYNQANQGVPPLTGCTATLNAATNLYAVNCAGLPAYNSPKWTANLAAQQTIELGDHKIVLGADTQYKTKRYIGFAYLDTQYMPSVWLSNAQISFGDSADRWTLSAYVRNIENNRTQVFSSLHPIASALLAGTTAPRTYGARASFKF